MMNREKELEKSLKTLGVSIIKSTLETFDLNYKQGVFDNLIKITPDHANDVVYVPLLSLVIHAGLNKDYANTLEEVCSNHSLEFLFIDLACIDNIDDIASTVVDKVEYLQDMASANADAAERFIANPMFGKFDKNDNQYLICTDDGVPVALVSGIYMDDDTFQIMFIGSDPNANLRATVSDLLNDTPSEMRAISIAIDISTDQTRQMIDDLFLSGFRPVAYAAKFLVLCYSCE